MGWQVAGLESAGVGVGRVRVRVLAVVGMITTVIIARSMGVHCE